MNKLMLFTLVLIIIAAFLAQPISVAPLLRHDAVTVSKSICFDVETYLTVNGGTGDGWKAQYSSVIITATVPDGYVFVNWTSVNTAVDNIYAQTTVAHIGGIAEQAVQAHIIPIP